MDIDRRRLLALGGASLASAFLAACDSGGPKAARSLLKSAARQNEVLERFLMRHTSMDHAGSSRLAGRALPSYFISKTVPMWDVAQRGPWALEVTGAVRKPLRLTVDDLRHLPHHTQKVNHYCVEGWTAVTQWTGVRVSAIAKAAGITSDAQYVDFQSFDSKYHESWDIESATHPQTMIAYALENRFLGPAHGAPARLHSPVKLGYKNVKYLTRLVFMPKRNGGYWSDAGYEWYGGT
ncbi:MAG: molybdopterin-dependent oxidoreductase [Longimicrobiales bacterium]